MADTRQAAAGPDLAQQYLDEFEKFGPVEIVQQSKLQKLGANRLSETWRTVPHVTHWDDADVSALEAARRAWNKASDRRLTLLPFLIGAAVAALQAFPGFNASLLPGSGIVVKSYYNIGIVVDTGAGLVIPVLRDCDRKSIAEISAEIADLVARARDQRLSYADMSGGCFSISSLGGVPGTRFTPIINAPEVAILGVSRLRRSPVWQDDGFVPRDLLPLSLSYDHRANNGVDAGRFLGHIVQALESASIESAT